jgi:hypothetical protein
MTDTRPRSRAAASRPVVPGPKALANDVSGTPAASSTRHACQHPEEPAMSIVRLENVPQCWNDQDDVPFFRIVARLFSNEFTYGAGVLLAGNTDVDDSAPMGPALSSPTEGQASVPATGTRLRGPHRRPAGSSQPDREPGV